MKKILNILLIFLLFINSTIYAASFNPYRVYNTIKELTKEKYAGRLTGDRGNELACNFVAKKFEEAGLSPLGDKNTFFQHFYAYVPFIEGKASFKVYDKNRLVKEYKYGVDFKEVPYGLSSPGRIKGSLFSQKNPKGKIFLSNVQPQESSLAYNSDAKLLNLGIKGIIYIADIRMNFKSTYKIQNEYKNGLIKIVVSSQYFDEIKEFEKKGYTFDISSPVKIKKVKTKNVIGIKKAKISQKPPIIFSAHLDHVGYDANKRIYPGALDNASGVSFLVELANFFKDIETNRDIIFVAFNAEEEGLLGSYYFVNYPPYPIKDAECINFDMIGSPKNITLSALKSPVSLQRYDNLDVFIKELNLNRLYEDNSDHAPFNRKNISAVTLIHNDIEKIHTPYDTIENIDVNKIDEAFKVVEKYLNERKVIIAISHEDKSINKTYIIYAILIPSIVLVIYKAISSSKIKIRLP